MSIAEGYGSTFQLQEQVKMQRHEIESLRQRVKELEKKLVKAQDVPMKYKRMEFNAQLQNENERLEKELAALKKLSDQWHEYYRRKHHPNCALLESAGTDSLGNKCTCIECIKQDLAVLVANGKEPNPTIPEGLQEARECILRAHIALSNRRGESHDAPRERADEAQIELELALKNLAATPKPSQQAAHMPVKTYCGGKPNYCKEQE